tara:strand:- start:174 stop:1436 length:1263 start_codon:yes stop_codon:yes gene_type:complete
MISLYFVTFRKLLLRVKNKNGIVAKHKNSIVNIMINNQINIQKNTLEKTTKHLLQKLKVEAIKNNKSITLNNVGGSLCIHTVLQELPLLYDAAQDIHNNIPNIKSYPNLIANNLSELITYIGGLEKTIRKLRYFLRQRKSPDEIDLYIDIARYCLILVSNTISKNYKKNKQNKLFFCSLCWRKPISSLSYCSFHDSTYPRNRSNYVRDRRLIIKEIKKNENFSSSLKLYETGAKLKHDLPEMIGGWFSNLIEKPVEFNLDKNLINSLSGEWYLTYERILNLMEKGYPITYKQMHEIRPIDYSSLENWLKDVIKKLDPHDYKYQLHDMMDWLNLTGDRNDWRIILNIFHRYETYQKLTTKKQPRGPKRGEVNKDELLRKKIIKLAQKQLTTKGKINAAEIGRNINKSRQRVSVIINELKLR